MSKSEQYEFDLKFYLIALAFAVVILGTPYLVKRKMDIAAGKAVQRLITKANLSSPEHYQRQAKNYCAGLAAQHKLTSSERKKAEAIYAKAFEEWSQTWIDGRTRAEPPEQTKARQRAAWGARQAELAAYLKSIGK